MVLKMLVFFEVMKYVKNVVIIMKMFSMIVCEVVVVREGLYIIYYF